MKALPRLSKLLQTPSRDTRDTLFMLLVMAWVVLPQVQHLPLWCSLFTAGVFLLRAWLSLTSRPLPSRAWLFGLLAVAMAGTFASHQTLLGRDAGVTFVVVLLGLKTLELRARRDAFVVFFLGFFVILTNFFYSQSLLTAASMLVGVLGLLTALVHAHMPVGQPPLWQAAKTAGWLALLGTPIMLVLFVLFPRVAPLWGVPSDAMAGRGGLGTEMEVGTIARLALDSSIAMRVRFEQEPPPQKDLYFRGPVLSNFDGRRWQPLPAKLVSAQERVAYVQVADAPVRYEITLEPTQKPWIFTLDAALQSPQINGYSTVMTSDLQWLTNKPVAELVRYQAQSHVAFRYGMRQTGADLQAFLALPPALNPRTVAWARSLRQDPRYARADAQQLTQAVMEQLRTGGYSYTLEPGLYGENTADEFWFDRKTGFCEHIASAFVVVMRALGVPARIVTGYQGGERNRVDGFWVLRQSDAHAWAEVWQAGQGWQRVDPTSAVAPGRTVGFERLAAPQNLLGQALSQFTPTVWTSLRFGWEAMNNRWNQWVLNYTQNQQLNLLKNLGFDTPSWQDLGTLLLALVVAVSLAGMAWAWWEPGRQDPWLRLLQRAKKRLAKAQVHSQPSTTPRALAQALELRYGRAYAGVQQWLLALELLRYAAPSQSAQGPLSTQAQKKKWIELKQQFKKLVWPQ